MNSNSTVTPFIPELYHNAGRISKRAFLTSTSVLLAVSVIATLGRFYIRFLIQKQFQTDDAFLVLGLCCLVCGYAALYVFIDAMYMAEALEFGGVEALATLPTNWLEIIYSFHRNTAITLVFTWVVIACVKMSFLFFFKRLIDRLRPMLMYWKFAFVVNILVVTYGILVYFVSCPHYDDFKSLQCGQGSQSGVVFNYSVSQMVLDVFSDLLILVIPVNLIWQIKIEWSQKIPLAFSLCLTLLLITFTIIRATGLRRFGDKIDSQWETYWQILSAEMGIILTTVATFRSFFITRRGNPQNPVTPAKSQTVFRSLLNKLSQRFRALSGRSHKSNESNMAGFENLEELPQLPKHTATMSGIRTFINGQSGNTSMSLSAMAKSRLSAQGEISDGIPLTRGNPSYQAIQVQHEICSVTEQASDSDSRQQRDMV